MNLERWRRVEELFNAALGVEPIERDAWLNRLSGDDIDLKEEIRSLLAADDQRADAALADPVRNAIMSFDGHPVQRRIGPYELVEQIGRGGMGTVYKAQRVDKEYHAVVAIKLVRPEVGAEAILQRFLQERQILARLTHPSIARLLDGGTTGAGIPYIVMEYIEGVSITSYCSAKRLLLWERLELFLHVCSAVDYAHRNFIIHRDIKPGNILIDKAGTPKLLDFGISKLFHSDSLEAVPPLTQSLAIMTPHYASPEQVLGEAITTRSDIYSLGAVLYEILTGTRAHQLEKLTPGAIEEAICRRDVALPSAIAADARIARGLTGDLDNIVMRALQKDPDRRYESAAALAEDVRRYLDDLPVLARPDTTWYRARKFVRRHSALVSGTAAVFVALAVGAAVAVRQAQIAEGREHQVRSLAKVFLFDVHDSVRDLPGATKARQLIVETAVRYLDALAGSNPSDPGLLRELAAGYTRVADIQGGRASNVGDPEAALISYRKAAGLLESLYARNPRIPSDRDVLISHLAVRRQIADVEARSVGVKRASHSLALAEAAARRLLAQFPQDRGVQEAVADALMVVGRRQREADDLQGSLTTTAQARNILETLADESPANPEIGAALAAAESAVGMTQARLANLAEAHAHYQRAVDENEKLHRLDPQSVSVRRNLMIAYSHVGDVLAHPAFPNLDDQPGAERAYRKMVELGRQLYEADAQDARALADYAFALMRLGAVLPPSGLAERQRHLQLASKLMHSVLERSPGSATMKLYGGAVELLLGDLFRDQSEGSQAAIHYQRAIELAEPLLSTGSDLSVSRIVVNATSELAKLEAPSRADRALALLSHALDVAEMETRRQASEELVAGRVLLPRVYAAFAFVDTRLGNMEQAAEWRVKALTAWKELSTRRGFTGAMRREMEAFETDVRE